MSKRGWIGVDLDGTLAFYDGWKGERHVGKPVPKMLARVRQWLADGIEVRIFTARVATTDPEELAAVEKAIAEWCEEHVGQKLAVTCRKDYQMVQLWDDRAMQVVPNTGESIAELYDALLL